MTSHLLACLIVQNNHPTIKGKGSSSKRALTVTDVLQTVEELVDSFQYEKAVKCCEEGLQKDPHNAALLEALGSLLL